MPGPHRKMVTQKEIATLSEGEGEGVARESGRAERGGRVDGGVRDAPGGRGEQGRPHVISCLRGTDVWESTVGHLLESFDLQAAVYRCGGLGG